MSLFYDKVYNLETLTNKVKNVSVILLFSTVNPLKEEKGENKMKILRISPLKKHDLSHDGKTRSAVTTKFALVAETEIDNLFLAFLHGPFADISATDPSIKDLNLNARKRVYVTADSGQYYLEGDSVVPHLIHLLPWNIDK